VLLKELRIVRRRFSINIPLLTERTPVLAYRLQAQTFSARFRLKAALQTRRLLEIRMNIPVFSA
jgi:hypothetical protein